MASDLAAAATLEYVGDMWGPTPIYRAFIADLNASIDVYGADETDARTVLQEALLVYL
jgi:hypothetical protein